MFITPRDKVLLVVSDIYHSNKKRLFHACFMRSSRFFIMLTFIYTGGKISIGIAGHHDKERRWNMTAIQQQAVQLIYQLPDEKIKAIITLALDELHLMEFKKQEQTAKKKNAFARLEQLNLGLPEGFDADAELASALEEKYGTAD